jgi:hypothetical protein
MRRKLISLLGIGFLTLFLGGCANNGVTTDDINVPIGDLQKLIAEAIPVKIKTSSTSGREFKSNYFIQKKGEFEEFDGGPMRSQVEVEILGDRRPYSVFVRVPVEKRSAEGHYKVIKYDDGTARVIIRRIQKALHERRDNRNIIDDFRAF